MCMLSSAIVHTLILCPSCLERKLSNLFLYSTNYRVLLTKFLSYSRSAIKIIYISFVISFLYNLIGISFAIQGMLSPIVAAVLMPLSSISVVLFATLSTNFIGKRLALVKLNSNERIGTRQKDKMRKGILSQ